MVTLRSHTDLAKFCPRCLRSRLTQKISTWGLHYKCSFPNHSPNVHFLPKRECITGSEWLVYFFQGYVGFGDGLVEKGKPEQTSPLSPALEKLLLLSKKNSDPARAGLSECRTRLYTNTSHTWSCCRGAVTAMTLPSETHAY